MKYLSKSLGMAIASMPVLAVFAPFTAVADLPTSGTVIDLTAGDRACYVTLENEAGETTTEFANFDICEADLIGKKVQLTYEAGNIVAESCNGDIDCGISEIVMLITAVQVIAESQYPPFLNISEIDQLQASLEEGRDSWFGLAGLNKVEHPPELSAELLAFRQSWKKQDPAIAPFLGLWHNDEYANNRHYVSIFPALRSGHVCVLEFKPEWSLTLDGENSPKDIISEGIFSLSLAKVGSAQLRSSEFRAYELAITHTEFGISETYPVELLPLMNDQKQNIVLAAANVPQLPPELSTELRQQVTSQLAENNCLIPSN